MNKLSISPTSQLEQNFGVHSIQGAWKQPYLKFREASTKIQKKERTAKSTIFDDQSYRIRPEFSILRKKPTDHLGPLKTPMSEISARIDQNS